MSLATKMIAGFALIALAGIFVCVFSFIEISKLDAAIHLLTEDSIVRLDAQTQIRIGVLEASWAQERWKNPLLSQALYEAEFAEMSNGIKRVSAAFERFAPLPKLPEAEVIFNDLNQTATNLHSIDQRLAQCAKEYMGKPEAPRMVAQLGVDLNRPAVVDKIVRLLNEMRVFVDKRTSNASASARKDAATAHEIILAFLVVIVVLGFGMGGYLSVVVMKLVTTVNDTVEALNRTSGTINTHSRELAQGSQSLATASSSQAASIEEISATLHELASTVKQNADNAARASKNAMAASDAVVGTNKAMQRSLAAMDEIAKASNETFAIIKSIDEIAFQTNLLSLNAAVEAARAGEAGAGFAVVASEVRGLSQRSAAASKRTAEMIEETINKVNEGNAVFSEAGKEINTVVQQAGELQELIAQVATATQEQAQGISQINIGVSEMEKAVQQNAATSEESASATQELFSQSDEMSMIVNDFAAYMAGKKKKLTVQQRAAAAVKAKK